MSTYYGYGAQWYPRWNDSSWQRNQYTNNQYQSYRGAGSPFGGEARYAPMRFGGNPDFARRFAAAGDRNRDGHIDRFEFQGMSGVNSSRLMPWQYRQALDANRDGRVDYSEAGRGLIATERSDNGLANGGISPRERDAMNWRLSTYGGRESVRNEIATGNPFQFSYAPMRY